MQSQPRGSQVRALAVLLVPLVTLGALTVTSPAEAQRIRPQFFGMHDADWSSAPSVPVRSANLTTAGTYWRAIQPRRDRFRWARLTRQVEGAEAAGAQPMIVLGQTPRFASTCRRAAAYYACMPEVRAWRSYVTKVAQRYGRRLDYQIWPEPNIVQNWTGSPREMARLTMVASKAITRYAGRNARVVSPAVALRLPEQQRWLLEYFKQRVGGRQVDRYVDAVAIDPFPLEKGSPEDSYRLMRDARSQLRRIGVRRPLWNNEINYGVEGGGQVTDTRLPVDRQQSYVIRTYVLSAAARMQRTYWLGWFAHNTMAVDMTDSSGTELPPAKSYVVVRSWLNRARFNGCVTKQSGLWVCTVKEGREVRRIYWKPGARIHLTLPRSATRLENQHGGVDTSPPRRRWVNFRPIMVASRR